MKVVEALFGYLIRKLVARRKERLVTLGEKDDLLLTGEMLLPHFIWQRQKECSLGLCEYRFLSRASYSTCSTSLV